MIAFISFMRFRIAAFIKQDRSLAILVFLVAFIPRILPPAGVFLNVDGAAHWVVRTKTFLLGLTSGDLTLLAPSGHPGIPLLWLTSAAEWFLQSTQAYLSFDHSVEAYIHILKIPLMITTSLLAVSIWWLGRQVFARGLALTLAALFALNPLYLEFSRYLQLDGLLTGFITVGIIAWWGALQQRRTRLAILAGIFLTLACLTRLNAILGLAFALGAWILIGPQRDWRMLYRLMIASAVTLIVVWPIVILHPTNVLEAFSWGVYLGFTPHDLVNTSQVPIWLQPFYFPLFILTRVSTLELGLFLVGGIALIRNWKNPSARPVWFVLTWVAVYVVGLMVARKHLDRYALPAVFGLLMVAAYGWHSTVWPWMRRSGWRWVLVGGVIVWQAVAFYRLTPYFQTYRNAFGQLLTHTPARVTPVLYPDWGEGLREAAKELYQRTGRWPSMASWYPAVLCIYAREYSDSDFPFNPRRSPDCASPSFRFSPKARESEYVLISRDQWAQHYYPTDEIAGLGWKPEFVVELNGHPYVWVYKNQGNLPEFR